MAGRLRQVTELYETELQRVTAERAVDEVSAVCCGSLPVSV